MKWLGKGRFRFWRSQRGFSLIEVVVAVAIISFIGAVFMRAMATSFRSAGIQDEQLTAESLARTQLEIVKFALYAPSYTVTVARPFQYSMSIASPYVLWDGTSDVWVVSDNDTNIQKITVAVSREGGKSVLSVEALKKK